MFWPRPPCWVRRLPWSSKTKKWSLIRYRAGLRNVPLTTRPCHRQGRTNGDPWKHFQVTVVEANTTTGGTPSHDTSVTYFDFDGSVDVSVTYQGDEPIESVQIRPYSYGNTPSINGRTIRFTLSESRNIVIQVNNDIWDCLNLQRHRDRCSVC